MKKGTFLAELSRLAALSSNADMYRLAAEELAYIYLKREYALSLVKEWLNNFHERWETRYRVVSKGETDNIWIIKCVLNLMWDWIDVRNIQPEIQEVWQCNGMPPSGFIPLACI